MSNSPAYALAKYLDSLSLGKFAETLFVSHEPNSPDVCVSLYDTGSFRQDEGMTGLAFPSVQIRIRGDKNGYLKAYDKADAVKKALLAIRPGTYSGQRIGGCHHISGPMLIGYDESRRPIVTVNVRVLHG